jgi:hypothetical protein
MKSHLCCKIFISKQTQEKTETTHRFFLFGVHLTKYKKNINPLKPTGHVTHHQFNIQQLYALPTLYLCVLCLCENKQRLETSGPEWACRGVIEIE